MRIIQTLWCGGQSLNCCSFGWPTPEQHLMAWALSANCLKKHYKSLCLFTDQQGAKVLIDQLQLPYDEITTDYDSLTCLPQHWAYAKIMSYARQEEPFLHVDSDIFISHPFLSNLSNAPLVAQNLEFGTRFYRKMADEVLRIPNLCLSNTILEGLNKESVASYNMGVFGGTDLEFIHKYCETVFRFYKVNHPGIEVPNCNVVTEQMFFAIIAQKENREVTCIFPDSKRDNGYLKEEFCDLRRFGEKKYFHILGGHKRHEDICKWIELTLLRLFPETYERIIKLFPDRHPILEIKDYDDSTLKQYMIYEQQIAYSIMRIAAEPINNIWNIKRNPIAGNLIKSSNGYEVQIPSFSKESVRIVKISDLGANILETTNRLQTIQEIRSSISTCFTGELLRNKEKQDLLVAAELYYLVYHGVILIADNII